RLPARAHVAPRRRATGQKVAITRTVCPLESGWNHDGPPGKTCASRAPFARSSAGLVPTTLHRAERGHHAHHLPARHHPSHPLSEVRGDEALSGVGTSGWVGTPGAHTLQIDTDSGATST